MAYPDPVNLNDSIQAFYVEWARLMLAEPETDPESIPLWAELNPDQRMAWMLAYAATVEVGARMGQAIAVTLSGN